ncbi:formate dehydrogenase subunit delta [Dyella psychrodurans]|uniref:Formate dehydrogenase subunit delta n=1 Tax=Dyella psychrodurans TaxID=1927960 RepID=A0A370WY00_9GAMM|nr:formate dehydrogenase subunit delta [Dyella psychrodurans]RDS81033.1 formate dehydrogenase subunit delta [Dyella psychrodurans]
MNIERLVTMANDISHYFAADPDQAAGAAAIADHLKKFWEPGMRKQIVAHLAGGGEGLEPLTRMGVQKLAELDNQVTAANSE